MVVRVLTADDRRAAEVLLAGLGELYPGAEAWLERRLSECVRGQAIALVAVAGSDLVGILILTPKGARLKISTIYVDPGWRRQGIGRELMRVGSQAWSGGRYEAVYLTVATSQEESVASLVAPYGLRRITIEADRYGPGRHESVLCWQPESERPQGSAGRITTDLEASQASFQELVLEP